MTLGQALTWILAILIAVWALNFGSTGWELLLLPASLMLGQVVVASGLVLTMVGRRREMRPEAREEWRVV
ncbi:hypothetical protein [Rhodococcus spelaei]|nr:hypothetical protein [Rhodococcus spelaei]